MANAEVTLTDKQVEKAKKMKRIKSTFRNNWQLYLLLLLPVCYILLFNYYPMYGAQIAFKNYNAQDGVWGSEWATSYGFGHFIRFFKSPQFKMLLENTLGISLYALLAGAPFPILLALILKYLIFKKYSKFVQSVAYAPHFISTVVMVSMVIDILSPRGGMIANLLGLINVSFSINLMGEPDLFSSIYVWSGIWQSTGFSAIIYTAILAGVDISLHEAADVDGATLMQRIRYIDFPTLIPQFTLMLILSLGGILNIGFEKALLMQNAMNASKSEIIDTYVYKMGIAAPLPDVSYTTAIGLFKSVVALILIVIVNKLARKFGETSLW